MVVRCLLVGVLMTAALAAQQGPAFDAVSIKRNTSIDRTRPPLRGTPSRFAMSDATGLQLLGYAFDRRRAEIIGAPEWTSSEHYDVLASTGHPVAPDEMKAMLRHMLADRFQLVAHTERREMQAFALVRARGDGRLGPRLRPWTADCAALRAGTVSAPVPLASAEAGISAPPCSMTASAGFFAAGGMPIAILADSLASDLGRRIVDRTELAGPFEILLEWAPDAAADRALPSLSVALQEQLGLKLESERAQVEVLVIDRIERPSEN